jgi:hypothetical protein
MQQIMQEGCYAMWTGSTFAKDGNEVGRLQNILAKRKMRDFVRCNENANSGSFAETGCIQATLPLPERDTNSSMQARPLQEEFENRQAERYRNGLRSIAGAGRDIDNSAQSLVGCAIIYYDFSFLQKFVSQILAKAAKDGSNLSKRNCARSQRKAWIGKRKWHGIDDIQAALHGCQTALLLDQDAKSLTCASPFPSISSPTCAAARDMEP